MGMLVVLDFLSVFAVRVMGSGLCFLLLAFCHAGSVSTPLKNVYEQGRCFVYCDRSERQRCVRRGLPSLQLVTSLPDSTKGVARGHVLVKGLWAGLTVHPDRQFAPNLSLKAPGMNKLFLVLPCCELGQHY